MNYLFIWIVSCALFLLSIIITLPSFAHHPFEGMEAEFSLMQGLISGFSHPIIGLDHLLFLLSIGIAGFKSPKRWTPLLLIFGFLGSSLALYFPFVSGLELFISLSLIFSAFVALEILHPILILPLIAGHGYVLAESMIGAESTPLIGYFLGIFTSEILVILLGIYLLRNFIEQRRYFAFGLIGVGLIMTFGHLIA